MPELINCRQVYVILTCHLNQYPPRRRQGSRQLSKEDMYVQGLVRQFIIGILVSRVSNDYGGNLIINWIKRGLLSAPIHEIPEKNGGFQFQIQCHLEKYTTFEINNLNDLRVYR